MRYKKLVLGLLSTVLLGTSFSVPTMEVKADNTAKSAVKEFHYNTSATIKSIKLNWKKQSGAAYYKVYRVKYKDEKNSTFPKKSNYKKTATVKAAKFTKTKTVNFTDEKTKSGVQYIYYINSYSKKKKLLGTTFRNDSISPECSGLSTPTVLNIGDEEYTNSYKTLYLSAENNIGAKVSGYIIYRKAAGDKNYKKVKKIKASSGYMCGYCKYADKTVKAGMTYYYKAKAFYKAGKKTYYSKKSRALKLMAVNFNGKYTANYLSTNDNEITFSLVSNKYNANTIVKKGAEQLHIDGSDNNVVPFELTQYSFDNKTWENIPDKGVTFEAEKTIYLKGTSKIPVGSTAEKAIIEFSDNLVYYNGGSYYFIVDFSAKKATADYDG